MSALTPVAGLLFAASVILQLIGVAALPLSQGLTNPLPTAVVLFSLNGSIYCVSLLIARGVQLSMLMPISAAVVPLGAVTIGLLYFGEAASWPKVALLVLACVAIGAAAGLK